MKERYVERRGNTDEKGENVILYREFFRSLANNATGIPYIGLRIDEMTEITSC